MKIQINDISIKNKILIKGTSIHVEENRIYVILGNNGVGKTLLLKKMFLECLNKDYNATYVDQSNDYVIKKCSLIENIAMSSDANVCQKVRELLGKYGLEYLLEHATSELSGGEKRIVCLLRAFFQQSSFLFIDEPTNDLDYVMVKKIQELFVDLQKFCTIIMVTHDDRMLQMATDVWNIKNHNLEVERKVQQIDLKKKVWESRKGEHNDLFLYRKLSFDMISVIVLMLISALCLYFSIGYVDTQIQSLGDDIGEAEVQIFIPLSEIGNSLLTDGAIPISALSCFDDTLTKSEQLDKFNSCLQMVKEQPVNFGLEYIKDGGNDKFELEYYDLDKSTYYNVLDFYLSYYGNGQSDYVDTSQYFYSDTNVGENALTLFKDKFEKSRIKMLDEMGKNLECSFVVISLDQDEDFFSFIQSGNLNQLMDGNFYIRSKETIQFFNQMMSFQGKRTLIYSILLLGVVLVLINSLCYFILLMANRKKLLCYKNIGANSSQAFDIVNEKYSNTKIKVMMVLIVFAFTFVLMKIKENNMLLGEYINVLLLILLFIADARTRKKIGKIYIKRIWDWRYR